MEHSLNKPNQCRLYGIRICDDPTIIARLVWNSVTTMLSRSECEVTHAISSPVPRHYQKLKRVGHSEFLTQIRGIRPPKFFVFWPSDGD